MVIPQPALDLIVIGAGAAGLLGAARAAERARRTLLLEKNRKPGVKILISGGTRCNLTHACDARGIVAAFGSAGSFLHAPLAALGPSELVQLFHDEGVLTYVEPVTDKVFPRSDRALDVVNALLRRLARSGAELALGEPAVGIERSPEGFRVRTGCRELPCAKLLVTSGGKSYPGCGTVGDGYAWLAALGHTIRQPRPALVPLTSDDAWVRELSGVTLPVRLQVVERDTSSTRERGIEPGSPSDPSLARRASVGRRRGLPAGVLIERNGALLFTHLGLSGPVAMDVSREVTKPADPSDVLLHCDFLPDSSPGELDDALRRAAAADGKKLAASLVATLLPQRLAAALTTQAGVPSDRRAAELSKEERGRLVEWIKQARINVSGTRGFEKAEVTAGGVALDEVDSRTMQSKLVPHLYLAGEILDLDGYIGGYNFQAAFSTGWLAGSSV